ncbi:CLUMA_CG011599, isoform A [Clunio marinus]|uniref:CLUMA_CG011599, isoform A n=1 Tax=Clunio marinus TaxID=568069 RepID=A0A1J1IFA7_9DIPT|nr:CLUMA_CG011599, isoform A [Clunio marinus]
MDDFPSEFDLVVVGTGFSESIIAAAASRVGKTVLHVDENDYYGGFWASFNFDTFVSHLEKSKDTQIKKCRLRNCESRWLEFTEDCPDINGWNKDKILKESRRFNIDLIPKMNFCNGKLVDLLISSNICRYTEFRAVDKVLTVLNGQMDIVPGSRADIFTKKNVSIIEKRLLMKFMNQCVEYDKVNNSEEKNEFQEFPENGKFIDLMEQQRLTENLIHYILHSMCMGNETTTFKEGIQRIRTYLSSIGRYGNTPFLFPMYGCGEIPQCFCRLCAVFGGVYCLGRPITDVKTVESNDEQVVIMKFGDQNITTKKLVHGLASDVLETQETNEFISRAPFVETFFREDYPSENEDDDTKPTIIFSSYFEVPSSVKKSYTTETQNGPIYKCCGAFMELDYDESIRQSKELYEKMYPDDEFLPKAPEPEEIIMGDEDATEGNVNLGVLADLVDSEEKDDEKKETPEKEENSEVTTT